MTEVHHSGHADRVLRLTKGIPCGDDSRRDAVEINDYLWGKILLEALKNGYEGDGYTGATEFHIRAKSWYGTPKISFWDNGPGMDVETLEKFGLLYKSGKPGANYMTNHGVGITIAAYKFNNLGIVVTSCSRNEDGEFEVNMIKIGAIIDKNGQQTWGYMPVDWDEDGTPSYVKPMDGEYPNETHTWTELVFLGNEDKQDTVLYPYGNFAYEGSAYNKLSKGQKWNWVNDLRLNFWATKGMKVYVADDVCGGWGEWMPLWKESATIPRRTGEKCYNHYDKDVIDDLTGAELKIHYLSEIWVRKGDNPKGHRKSGDGYEARYKGNAMTVAAIVCPDGQALTGVMGRSEWVGKAINAGFYSKAENYSVFVEIVKQGRLKMYPSKDRTQLCISVDPNSPANDKVDVSFFFDLIKKNIPQEIKAEMEASTAGTGDQEHWAALYNNVVKGCVVKSVDVEKEIETTEAVHGGGGDKTIIDINAPWESGVNPVKPGAGGKDGEGDGSEKTARPVRRRAMTKMEKRVRAGVPIQVVWEWEKNQEHLKGHIGRLLEKYGMDERTTWMFNRAFYEKTVLELSRKHELSVDKMFDLFEKFGLASVYCFVCAHYIKNPKQVFDLCKPEVMDAFALSEHIWNNEIFRSKVSKAKKIAGLNVDEAVETLDGIINNRAA